MLAGETACLEELLGRRLAGRRISIRLRKARLEGLLGQHFMVIGIGAGLVPPGQGVQRVPH